MYDWHDKMTSLGMDHDDLDDLDDLDNIDFWGQDTLPIEDELPCEEHPLWQRAEAEFSLASEIGSAFLARPEGWSEGDFTEGLWIWCEEHAITPWQTVELIRNGGELLGARIHDDAEDLADYDELPF